jgi:hypothetical protein
VEFPNFCLEEFTPSTPIWSGERKLSQEGFQGGGERREPGGGWEAQDRALAREGVSQKNKDGRRHLRESSSCSLSWPMGAFRLRVGGILQLCTPPSVSHKLCNLQNPVPPLSAAVSCRSGVLPDLAVGTVGKGARRRWCKPFFFLCLLI